MHEYRLTYTVLVGIHFIRLSKNRTMNRKDLKLVLVDPIAELCNEWRLRFEGMPDVEVVNGSFENLAEYDCMVSAGNSSGLMDGGVDGAIPRYFGLDLMNRVQTHIIQQYRGEQPIGTSFITPQHPFLAHTPTMRVPMAIATTDNVYQAMWAMLLAVWHHNQSQQQTISTIACPDLRTATGQVPFE